MMVLFESAVEGSLEGSRGDRLRLRRHAHRATRTPPCLTQLPRAVPFLGAAMLLMLPWDQSLHQTRGDSMSP